MDLIEMINEECSDEEIEKFIRQAIPFAKNDETFFMKGFESGAKRMREWVIRIIKEENGLDRK